MRPAATACFLLLLSALLPAQDPPTPAKGFPITGQTGVLVTLSDGMRTRADVHYPSVAAGPTGWPLLVGVHGLGGNRGGLVTLSRNMAKKGFFLVAYDVRGQGDAGKLSPTKGTTLIGLEEKIDLAEIIEWAAQTYPGTVDLGRVGVFGSSQGGLHSWSAAAWSGRTLPANSRRTRPFPKIAAVAPAGFIPEGYLAAVPKGHACHVNLLFLAFFSSPNLIVEPTLKAKVAGYLLGEDYPGLAAYLANDPGRGNLAGLKTTTTAVFAAHGWHDYWASTKGVLDGLSALPAPTPRGVGLGIGGHGSPQHDDEGERQADLRKRWFMRFLKGEQNKVELESTFRTAAIPADRAAYLNKSTLLMYRQDSSFPPGDTSPLTYYLRAGARLTSSPPTISEPSVRISHRVPSGFDIKAFLITGGIPGLAFAMIPLSSAAWTTIPMPVETEFAGTPVAELFLRPTARRMQLHVALFLVDPSETETMVSSGLILEEHRATPSLLSVKVSLDPMVVVVPKGWRLRLRVENHSWLRFPGQDRYRVIPYLLSVETDVLQGPSQASRLVLPKRKSVRTGLTARHVNIKIGAPPTTDMVLSGGLARAGRPYLVLAGLSGQVPAAVIPGCTLPLNMDASTPVLFSLATLPPFSGFIGSLNQTGQATPALDWKALTFTSSMAGLRLTLAAVVGDPQTFFPVACSGAVDMVLSN